MITERTIKQMMLCYGIDKEEAICRCEATQARVKTSNNRIKASGLFDNSKILFS